MPLTTYHWGTYEIITKDGALTALRPFAEDPDPSRIGPSLVDLLDHPARIKRPAVRRSWLDHGLTFHTSSEGCESSQLIDEISDSVFVANSGRARTKHL